MTDFTAQLEMQQRKITKLEQDVLHLQKTLHLYMMRQREIANVWVGSTEDYLDTPCNQSLLHNRQRKVRQ